ncbi:DUF305 domain-containing protein [bacterium]|nr:DUF305 domain-containing protein [bacterium]
MRIRGFCTKGVGMMVKVRLRRLLYVLMAAMAIVAITATTPAYAKSKSKKKAQPTKQQVKFEKDFLKKMMDRHQRGIKLAQWVDSKTTDVQLNAFCENFIVREQNEVTSMSAMLKSWYGITYTPKNKSVSGDDIEDMQDSETPEEFALEALGSLKGYDKNEIAQMKQPAKKAYHQELKDFAKALTAIDRAECSYIQDWIKYIESLLGDDEDNDEDDD